MRKRIGILTSGGDCAGLNAAIRAVTFKARALDWNVIGIQQGTYGLFQRPVACKELRSTHFQGNELRMGGTILGSMNKGSPFAYKMPDGSVRDRSDEIVEGLRSLEIEALIGIGGNGSLAVLSQLARKGEMPFIGIPKTIDNDLGHTETAIGFQTAVDVATEALDRLQPTAASHDRVMILEVMGREAGHIALHAGIAGGADVILLPEIPYKLDNVVARLRQLLRRERNFALVVVAEAVPTDSGEAAMIVDSEGKPRYGGIGHYLTTKLQSLLPAEVRCTVLGHVQRGGQPDASDRLLASAMGVHAVELVVQKQTQRMVAWQHGAVTNVAIEEALKVYNGVRPDETYVKTARALGISFGD